MIAYYEFIDGKPGTGLKERVLGPTIFLYNKLSADETNNIRAKLNELVDAANFSPVPLFGVFGLKFKGDGNTDILNLETGDIAHVFFSDGIIWENARYNGGDPTLKASYTNLDEPLLFISDGATNSFEVPEGFTANNLFIDRGMRYKFTEWNQVGSTVTLVGAIIAINKKVYITT